MSSSVISPSSIGGGGGGVGSVVVCVSFSLIGVGAHDAQINNVTKMIKAIEDNLFIINKVLNYT